MEEKITRVKLLWEKFHNEDYGYIVSTIKPESKELLHERSSGVYTDSYITTVFNKESSVLLTDDSVSVSSERTEISSDTINLNGKVFINGLEINENILAGDVVTPTDLQLYLSQNLVAGNPIYEAGQFELPLEELFSVEKFLNNVLPPAKQKPFISIVQKLSKDYDARYKNR
jgi:hypothetical protein